MRTLAGAAWSNFLGNAAAWYKQTIVAFLILNPVLLWAVGPFVTGWILVLQFIFTLAMALRCYPLQPGGLLAVEAVVIGMASAESVRTEVVSNLPVILLLMFMVAGIYFMKDLLLFTFTKILLGIRSKIVISLVFSFAAAFLSAFLDALTVIAVIITTGAGFYAVYHRVASGRDVRQKSGHDHTRDDHVPEFHREDLEGFRAFLRSLMMHGAVGTALGGVATMVGEPQNLLIAIRMDWSFGEFFQRVAPVSVPVLLSGLATCVIVEKFSLFGYGGRLSERVRGVLQEFDLHESENRTMAEKSALVVQAISALILIVALGFHWAEVGLIGLMIIVIQTAFNGVTEEHQIGKAFQEALPFTALIVVFFAIVAVIHDQELFAPVTDWVLALEEDSRPGMLYVASGLLSAISDNVFVATVYINELSAAFQEGHFDREHFNVLAVAVNTGTNIPSVATPNGQAAFLFLLTSAIAPLIRLSYLRMVVMALPYTIVLSVVGYLSLVSFL